MTIEIPHVQSNDSKGRRYKNRIIDFSNSRPITAATRKLNGKDTTKYQPNASLLIPQVLIKKFCTMNVV